MSQCQLLANSESSIPKLSNIPPKDLDLLEHCPLHVMSWPSFRKWQVQPLVEDTIHGTPLFVERQSSCQRLCGLVAQWSTLLNVQLSAFLAIYRVFRIGNCGASTE
jgi:hypothetical protein